MTVRDDGEQPLSIQQQYYPQISCFGCGPTNSRGLQLHSYLNLGEVVATFTPWPEHDNGVGYLNGGIISTLLDCHGAAAVMLEANNRDWVTLPGTALPFLTAGLDVRFLRPAPLQSPAFLCPRRHAHTAVPLCHPGCGTALGAGEDDAQPRDRARAQAQRPGQLRRSAGPLQVAGAEAGTIAWLTLHRRHRPRRGRQAGSRERLPGRREWGRRRHPAAFPLRTLNDDLPRLCARA
jgi:hypothetical protein